MYSKIQIRGKITVETGMHIGGSSQFSAIGAVDSTVIRDVGTNLPIIPGSSLKGKMRTLLAKKYNQGIVSSPDDDHEIVLRLFGSAKKGNIKTSRLLFSDMLVSNMDELNSIGLHSATEIKFENTINRLTSVANPRQIERVIRGTTFDLKIIYDAQKEDEIEEDFKAIKEGFKLLQYDYLGGHGSRGYGKIKISDIEIETVVGEVDSEILKRCRSMLKEV
ncbi:MAG TPA: type III-A CRISPR-associated RAMP protein Csm3 [Tissierellia bacterium]|jgi:CRISPR-associated protein Csm3|nr:type III-A CRISPR-associated RAMP protein Csm3 [Tissierellia bacterium]